MGRGLISVLIRNVCFRQLGLQHQTVSHVLGQTLLPSKCGDFLKDTGGHLLPKSIPLPAQSWLMTKEGNGIKTVQSKGPQGLCRASSSTGPATLFHLQRLPRLFGGLRGSRPCDAMMAEMQGCRRVPTVGEAFASDAPKAGRSHDVKTGYNRSDDCREPLPKRGEGHICSTVLLVLCSQKEGTKTLTHCVSATLRWYKCWAVALH